jgi:hypothetical protein
MNLKIKSRGEMSLNIYLESDPAERICICTCCDNEHKSIFSETVYEANITHNLGEMADAAGIYQCMWRPEEINIKKAKDMIEILEKGYEDLINNAMKYHKYSPKNGWGSYEGLCNFVLKLIEACIKYPDSNVRVWR